MRVSYAIFNRRGSSRLIPRGEAWQWHWHLEDDADLADLVNGVAARLGRERLELLNLRVSHTDAVSMEIIRPLIAYLRFASVYQAFESLDDFDAAISELRAHPSTGSFAALTGDHASRGAGE